MDNFNKTDDLYDPNFSISSKSTEKLDMYGVWLKKKKDTVEPIDTDDSQAAHDSGSETNNDTINFDDDFSFSDSFSDMNAEVEAPEFDEPNDEQASDEVPLETPDSSYAESDSSDVPLDEDNFESLDLDDFLSDDTPAETEQQETSDTFVEEEPIDMDFTDIADEAEKPSDNDTPPAGLENFSEISLDDFEDAAPEEVGDGFETIDGFDDILKDDDATEQKEGQVERKADSALDMNVTDDDASKVQSISELSSQVAEENADILIFGTDDDETEEDDSDAETPAFFDDIEAVKQDLLSPQHPTEHDSEDEPAKSAPEKDTKDTMNTTSVPSNQSAAEQDKATELLMKIAHEISDLKEELNSLKVGIVAQSRTAAEMPVKDTATHQEDKPAATESSGFFSDDDTDETIALTGDELNNILITADFTEERNAEDGERTVPDDNHATEEADEDYEVPPVLTKDIDPDMEETPPADQAFEDSIAEISSTDTDNTLESETEGEKLLASDPVFNVEAAPITSLPEDLSYLDDQSEVTDEEGIELIDEDSIAQEEEAELEEIEDAEPADEETNFEDITIESFDIPSEQEIEVPEQDAEPIAEEAPSAPETNEDPTIHELQNDEDFPNPFGSDSNDSEANIDTEEDSIEASARDKDSDTAQAAEETNAEEPIENLEEISEAEPKASESESEEDQKQETLLQAASKKRETISIPLELKNEIKSVLSYMDQLLEALPEKKIEEFAKSEYFETYKHLFEELGIS